MRVLFCGSGSLGLPSLGAVAAAGHEWVGVVTQPARPAGRGGKVRPTPLGEAARTAGLDVIETPKINDPASVAWIADRRPDAICVVDFGQMVRAAVRACARLDTVNLHASMLPELRGAAPINWAVIRGCTATGLTTFSLADQLDAGPIYAQEAVDVRPDETADELRARCAQRGAAVLCRTLELLAAGAKPTPQDESRVTLAPLLKKSDGRIDWSAGAATIRNLIHGTWPWPGGQAVFHRRRDGQETPVTIARAAAEAGTTGVPGTTGVSPVARVSAGGTPAVPPAAEPGCVDADLCVAAGAGRVRIVEIKPAGGRLMGWRDFVNGHRVAPGDRFLAVAP